MENRYSITIKIEEGDQYRVGDVQVTGNKQFTADEIRGVLRLVRGQVYNESMLRNNFDRFPETTCGTAGRSLYIRGRHRFEIGRQD